MGKGGFSAPLPQRCHFASISLPRGFHKDRISARSVLKCFPFETRARLKNNAPATVSRGRPQCTACFWKCTNLSLSSHNNDMGLPDGRCSRIRPGTVPSSVFHLFRGILFLQNINFIFYFQCISIDSFRESHKKQKLYLKKNFNFTIIFLWTTRKQAVSRLQSSCCREIGTEAGKWLARLPSRMPIPPSEAVLRHPAKKFPNTWVFLSFACSHCLFQPKRASVQGQKPFHHGVHHEQSTDCLRLHDRQHGSSRGNPRTPYPRSWA